MLCSCSVVELRGEPFTRVAAGHHHVGLGSDRGVERGGDGLGRVLVGSGLVLPAGSGRGGFDADGDLGAQRDAALDVEQLLAGLDRDRGGSGSSVTGWRNASTRAAASPPAAGASLLPVVSEVGASVAGADSSAVSAGADSSVVASVVAESASSSSPPQAATASPQAAIVATTRRTDAFRPTLIVIPLRMNKGARQPI